ncbi:hypothetical protein [Thauera sp. WB-2]|nr:hypothetical protein [Thauera sp. WB-2]
MGHARDQGAKRSQFLALQQLVLGTAQMLERSLEFARPIGDSTL